MQEANTVFIAAISLMCSVPTGTLAGPWREYEVYQPTVEREFVVNAAESELKYNHDSAVAWFGDRWFCLWNGNQVASEGKPGQLNYVATSEEGSDWTEPRAAFSDAALCENPVPCETGTQWQPNLIVVDGALWAVWSQNSRDEHNGCYLSVLDGGNGKWVNRKILFEGSEEAKVDGNSWRVFPTQNPYRLRSGRVLAPVTLMGPEAADAPESVTGWWRTEKRDSVIYTDDGGETWRCSPGAVQEWATWAQWEPTVWELVDGTVMMFARNNDFRGRDEEGPRPTEALLWSESYDGGETWTPHQYVPLKTVVSRMHVLPGGGDRWMMVYNDWPAGRAVHDRKNLALFFTRGAGIDFVAGPGVSGQEPFVMYPQMWVNGEELLVSYSQGNSLRSIKVARVSPLPKADTYYLFPRSNVPPPQAPRLEGGALIFDGTQRVEGLEVLELGEEAFSARAVLGRAGDGTLLDNRTTNPQAGVLWGLARREGKLVQYFFVGSAERNLFSTLEVPGGQKAAVGISVDHTAGSVTFAVNGEEETIPYAKPANRLTAATPYVGYKRFEESQVSGFTGVLETLEVEVGARRVLLLDAARAGLGGPWKLPEEPGEGVETVVVEGVECLRFRGEASAGVDLDENARGDDVVEVHLRFRVESGEEHVILTVGDANEPARVVAREGAVWLEAEGQRERVGAIQEGWTEVDVRTVGDRTEARVGDGEAAEVRHEPVATWVYLGEGYRRGRVPAASAFVVDVGAVRTAVGGRQ